MPAPKVDKLNYITSYFQNYIREKDIRSFKNKRSYFLLFRLLRKFFDQNIIVNIYNFKVFASYKKNNTSHALLRKCDFDDITELSLLKSLSKKKKIVFIDCGANYGFYSLFVAGLSSRNKIISVEASESTSRILKENIELNSFKNITPLNVALSNIDNQEVVFNESVNDWESSISHKNFKLSNQTSIFTKKLDSVIKDINILDEILFIKLDIEGNEFSALKGAYQIIQKFEPIIIIEFSRFIFNSKNSEIFLSNFVDKFDYKIYNNKKVSVNQNEIFELIKNLDKKHNTIGNYFLIKNNSKNLNLFLETYE